MSSSDEPTEGRGGEGEGVGEGVVRCVSRLQLTPVWGTRVIGVEGPCVLSIHAEALGEAARKHTQ